MWPRLSIVAGLLAGVAVAGMVIGAILLLGPAPTAPVAAATPSPAPVVSASASAIASPSAVASPSASASPSAGASGEPGASASASGAPSGAASASPSAETLFHIGEPAPALKLPKVGGGTIDLADLNGSPVWVNFMSTNSPPSQEEFPLMSGFASRYADAGLVVVAVDVKEDEATVAAFANDLAAIFPIALDKDGSAAARWAANALPVHYWIDAEGIVRDAALGGIGSDIMARGVTTILPGVDVQP